MKQNILESLKLLVADRYLLVSLSIITLLSLTFAVIIGLSIHPSELQLVSHYSAFGVTHFYLDQWVYLFVFVVFGVVVSILHSIISVKLLVIKGHPFAVLFVWAGVGIIILDWITVLAILNVWTPL